MAHVQESVVTLRIVGDNLVPDEITKLLGSSPTAAETKGEKIVGRKTGHVRIAKMGSWRLHAKDREPEDMDGQIQELLGHVTSDLKASARSTRSIYYAAYSWAAATKAGPSQRHLLRR
jgi:uncharacterized protein DUF4279